MKLEIVTAPSSEPITLAEAKLHLRIDFSADDDLITSLIEASRVRCEAEIGQAFVTTVFDYYLDRWPTNERGAMLWKFQLPRAPVASVASITYYDSTNALTTWSTSEYDVSTGSPGRIGVGLGYVFPVTYNRMDAIKIRFTAGYGAASAVPANIKAAIKADLTNLYENRGDDGGEPSPTVKALLWGSYHGSKYA